MVRLPLGLLAIADFIRRNGYSVQVVHTGLEQSLDPHFSLESYLAAVRPRVAGLSLHWHYQSYDVMRTAEKIKSCGGNIFVALGGLTASHFHEEIMRDYPCVDAVVRGEGELPFLRMMEKVTHGRNDLSSVPNLTWRENGSVSVNKMNYSAGNEELNGLCFTNFSLLKNYQAYINSRECHGRWLKGIRAKILSLWGEYTYFPVLLFRGCMVDCSYCGGGAAGQNSLNGRRGVSIRSVEKVMESIREAGRYGFKGVYIPYMPFPGYGDYYLRLFADIRRERPVANYFLECYALPSGDHIRAFRGTLGCSKGLCLGISPDSGSEDIRRKNKGFFFSNNELCKVLETAGDCGLKAVLYFSVGLPFQNAEHIRETVFFQDFLKRRFKDTVKTMMTNIVLEPASPMYRDPEGYGILRTRFSFDDFLRTDEQEDKEGFLTPRPGFFKKDFACGRRTSGAVSEYEFRRQVQRVICRYSCRLGGFIDDKLPPGLQRLLSPYVRICAVFICRMCFSPRRLRSW